jgi:hypothetical protein
MPPPQCQGSDNKLRKEKNNNNKKQRATKARKQSLMVNFSVTLVRLWWPAVWSNTSLDIAVKVFFTCDQYLNQ